MDRRHACASLMAKLGDPAAVGRDGTATSVGSSPRGVAMVKIVDVAEAAQVSAATVSRALNYSSRVDPALAERVRATAERLGYRPNAVARNLRRRGTLVWALIITDINNPFYTAVARGVEDQASKSGLLRPALQHRREPEQGGPLPRGRGPGAGGRGDLGPAGQRLRCLGPGEWQDPARRGGPTAGPAGGLRHGRILRGGGDGHRAPAASGLAATCLRHPACGYGHDRATPSRLRGRDAATRLASDRAPRAVPCR